MRERADSMRICRSRTYHCEDAGLSNGVSLSRRLRRGVGQIVKVDEVAEQRSPRDILDT